ncbi:general substrate transporter [Ochromonadaceae sp. CCMP2298]|nr:general substrate transporter [Ochromonadaceae sp. CCMP2298]
MWRAAFLIASQSFLFGFVFSCLNACLVTGDNNKGSDCFNNTDNSCPRGTMYNDINLSTLEAQLATSLTIVGAWVGSLVGSIPSQQYGKRLTLIGNSSFFIIGAALSCTGNIYALFAGRLVSGVGVGIASGIPSVLLSEIATPATRGTITTVHQIMVTFGIFMAAVMGYGFCTYVDHGWQLIQAFGAVPAIFMIIMQGHVPESPKWQLMQTDISLPSAISSMHRMNRDEELELDSSSSTSSAVTAAMQHEMFGLGADVTWTEVFNYKLGMTVGLGLMIFQALTGVNSVIFYSTTIFGLAGFSESIIGTSCVGLVNLLMTVLTAYLIDIMGRKILLLTGTYMMLFALLTLSSVLVSPIDSGIQGVVAVLAVLFYIAGFAMGLGAVVWSVLSEIMPTRLRVKAISLFLSFNWGSNLIIGLLTLTAIDELGGVENSMDDDETADAQKKGVAYMYFIFASITALSLVFMHFFVPETKGKTVEELSGKGGGAYAPLLAREK